MKYGPKNDLSRALESEVLMPRIGGAVILAVEQDVFGKSRKKSPELIILSRQKHAKKHRLVCFCKLKRGKAGDCMHTRRIVDELLTPAARAKVLIEAP